MIKITKTAADQINNAAKSSDSEGMALRVAAKINPDGSYEYGVGFDHENENDIKIMSEGVRIVVSPACSEILEDAVLDYVEMEPGNYEFTFFNPNDPDHKPPKEDK